MEHIYCCWHNCEYIFSVPWIESGGMQQMQPNFHGDKLRGCVWLLLLFDDEYEKKQQN